MTHSHRRPNSSSSQKNRSDTMAKSPSHDCERVVFYLIFRLRNYPQAGGTRPPPPSAPPRAIRRTPCRGTSCVPNTGSWDAVCCLRVVAQDGHPALEVGGAVVDGGVGNAAHTTEIGSSKLRCELQLRRR